MDNKNTLRWLFCFLVLLVFIMPVLLADEFSLLANWLFVFCSWLIIILASWFRARKNEAKK